MSFLYIELVTQWPTALLEKLSAFYTENPDRHTWSMWSNRWSSSPNYFRWKCADNPIRTSIAAIAVENDRIVGSVIVTYKHMVFKGQSILAGELGDIYIWPTHRKQGLFGRLVATALAGAKQAGAEIIYCVPNSNGFQALIATGQFAPLPEAEHATWLLALRPFWMLSATRLWLTTFEPLDGIFRQAMLFANRQSQDGILVPLSVPLINFPQTASELRVAFTPRVLEHRLLEGPGCIDYRILLSGSASNSGAILRAVKYNKRPALLVGRSFADNPNDFGYLVTKIVKYAMTERVGFVAMWAPYAHPYARELMRRFFIPFQRKRIAIDAAANLSARHAVLKHLHIEMLDSDKA